MLPQRGQPHPSGPGAAPSTSVPLLVSHIKIYLHNVDILYLNRLFIYVLVLKHIYTEMYTLRHAALKLVLTHS